MSADVLVLNWATDPNVTGVTDVLRFTIETAFPIITPSLGPVDSVNGVGPDGDSNVELTPGDIGATDASVQDVGKTGVIRNDGSSLSLGVTDDLSGDQTGFSITVNDFGISATRNSGVDGGLVEVTPESAVMRSYTGAGATKREIRLTPTTATLDNEEITTEGDYADATETQAGTATDLVVTPAGLAAALRSPSLYVLGDGSTNQSIPNATWTTVNFQNGGGTDGYPAGGWDISQPTRIYMTALGYNVMLGEVAWACNGTGVRRVRWIGDGLIFFTACETAMPGLPADVAHGFTVQHMQCYVAGPVQELGHYNELQVWQNSGGPLDLRADGFAAPQVMVFYPTP